MLYRLVKNERERERGRQSERMSHGDCERERMDLRMFVRKVQSVRMRRGEEKSRCDRLSERE